MRELICHNCGASLSTSEKLLVCPYCNTQYLLENSNKVETTYSYSANEKYDTAYALYSNGKSSDEFLEAAKLFEEIQWFKNSKALLSECLKKSNELHKIETYAKAIELAAGSNIYSLNRAVMLFETILNFRDSNEKKEQCLAEIERQSALLREKNKNAKERNTRERNLFHLTLALIAVVVVVIYAIIVIQFV